MEFQKFCSEHSKELRTSSPRYPQSNGISEHALQKLKQLLRKVESEPKDVSELLLEYRYITIPQLGAVLCELLMSRSICSKFSINNSKLRPKVQTNISVKQQKYKQNYKNNYDQTACDKDDFKKGDKVLLRAGSKWITGIVRAKGNNSSKSYLVQGPNGAV